MVRKLALLIVVWAAVPLCYAQNPPQNTKERWNKVYSNPKPTYPTEPNKFLTEVVRGRKTGKALDVGMGSGRNSLFLAQQGWEVTGVDISDEGIRVAKKQAAKLGVKLRAVLQSADEFNFGKEQWDLILGMYVHKTFTQNAVRIREGLKPGGIVVVEGFHRSIGNRILRDGKSAISRMNCSKRSKACGF
jgi:2-polyprenyl-3-methyl-5-hydroxy-6-metoxy-1,4-benzoquinol methylase